jgi:CRP-like cAMP-binding protein
MGSSVSIPALCKREIDDPLLHLPCSTIVQADRGDVIYGPEQPCKHLYVVIAGTIQVSRLSGNGVRVIIDVYRTDEFFGESTLVGVNVRGERAVALEKAMLMNWPADEVDRLLEIRPKLGLGLLRVMARRELDLTERLASLSLDNIPVRLAKSLLRLSERLGISTPDGVITMRAFSQEFLAEYIGSSRELVSVTMNEWRRQEIVRYSRREISFHDDTLRRWIRSNP